MSTKNYYYMKWLAIIFMLADHTAYFLKGLIDDNTYLGLRTIGRLALMSKIPYNLFMTEKLNDFRYQNVCFTLVLGFLMMCINNLDMDKFLKKHIKSVNCRRFIIVCVRTDITALFCLTMYLFNTDYSASGVILQAK